MWGRHDHPPPGRWNGRKWWRSPTMSCWKQRRVWPLGTWHRVQTKYQTGFDGIDEHLGSPSATSVYKMPEGGCIPRAWRTAKLALLKEEDRPLDSPAAYRLVCLLDEVRKFLKRSPPVWRPIYPSGCLDGTTASTAFGAARPSMWWIV